MSKKLAVLITAVTLLTPLKTSAASPLAFYSVGNSLTADLRASGGVEALAHAQGTALSHDYHVRCGSSLTGIVANATQTCVPPLVFGSLTEAFAPQAAWQIDAVSLQPFYGATIREEIAAAQASETQQRFVGINGPLDLYRDDIHASNLGWYVAGLVAHAAIVGEAAQFAEHLGAAPRDKDHIGRRGASAHLGTSGLGISTSQLRVIHIRNLYDRPET